MIVSETLPQPSTTPFPKNLRFDISTPNSEIQLQKMLEDDPSVSDSQENESNSSSEDLETLANGGDQKIADYERQRRRRIEQNRARMEALGLKTMASALMGSAQNTKKKSESKGKAKMVKEDGDYRPREGEEGSTSSSEENEEFSGSRRSNVTSHIVHVFSVLISDGHSKTEVNKKYSTPKKKVPVQKLTSNSDFIDDDEALMQAIALSLKDSAECPDVGCSGIPQRSSVND